LIPDDRPASAGSRPALDPDVRERFTAFVRANRSLLLTIGVAVSGSRVEAEDLVQTALANAFPRWHTIADEQALAYVRRSILNANVSRWRRMLAVQGRLSEPAEGPDSARDPLAMRTVDDRLSLVPLLRDLPTRQRAVLVLRYLCDLPDDQIAHTLGIAPGTVRSQAARGLATLRARSAELLDSDSEDPEPRVLAPAQRGPREAQ
jgi:RNA polymerase sigma-70 factor (sigma-E family)